jgi:hypothetical protein
MTTTLAVPNSGGQAKDHKSPQEIIDSLDEAVDKAHKSGDLLLFDSTMSSVEEDGVQVRHELIAAPRICEPAWRCSISSFFPIIILT